MTELLRGVMFVEGIVCGLLYAHVIGVKFFTHGVAYKFTSLGFGGLISYASAIQVKAYKRQAPFDLFSTSGLVALTLLTIGLTLYVVMKPAPTDEE